MVVRKTLRVFIGFGTGLLVLGFLAVTVGFFTMKGLHPSIFRLQLAQYLSEQTRLRAEVGAISLHWGLPVKIRVKRLEFYHPKTQEKLLQSDDVVIQADPTSFWSTRFWMPQILIHNPEINIKRNTEGVWNWQVFHKEAVVGASGNKAAGIAMASAKVAAVDSGGNSLPFVENRSGELRGWELGLGEVHIHNGTLHFTDETMRPAFPIRAEKVDLAIYRKALIHVLHFKATTSIRVPLQKDLSAEGTIDVASQSSEFVLRYGQDEILLNGGIQIVKGMPRFSGELRAKDLRIEAVIPEVYKQGEYLSGLLNAQLQMEFEGARWGDIQRTLRGQGNVEIRDGALKNRNLVKEVFDNLSSVIAMTNALGGELPPEMGEMLEGRDTPFQFMGFSSAVRAGVIATQDFLLSDVNYRLNGNGTLGLGDQRIDSGVQLVFSPMISAYFMKKIRELQFLSDKNGCIVVPFRYEGVLPEATVRPDLPYIASKVLGGGAEQLINRGLEELAKILEPKK